MSRVVLALDRLHRGAPTDCVKMPVERLLLLLLLEEGVMLSMG